MISPVCKLQTKFQNLTSEVNSKNLRSISQRFTISHNSLWNAENAGLKNTKRSIKCGLYHATSPNLLDDVTDQVPSLSDE